MIVAIDIGNKGGWVRLDEHAAVVDAGKLPIRRTPREEPDDDAVHDLVTAWIAAGVTVVYAEQAPGSVRINGRSNPAATRSLALWVGIIRGACARRMRLVLVPSATWKAEVLHGVPGYSEKARALAYCRSRWRDADRWLIPAGCREPQDGIADAAALGSYAWTCERLSPPTATLRPERAASSGSAARPTGRGARGSTRGSGRSGRR